MTSYTSNVNVTQRQKWSGMDVLGNWLATLTTQAGVTTTDARTHNLANEIEERSLTEGTNGAVSAEFAYDHNGNLTNDGEFVYEYDVENRLTRASRITGTDPLTTEIVGEYFYDTLSRRVATIEYEDPQIGTLGTPRRTQHVYCAIEPLEDFLYDVSTCGWTLAREFIWGTDFPDPIAIVDHTDLGDLSAGEVETLQYMPDMLGNVVSLTDSAGVPVERSLYDPFGKTIVEHRNPNTGVFELTGSVNGASPYSYFGNPFMWTGQRCDAVPNLQCFLFRTYSQATSRWNQRDPLGYVDGISLFEYANGNPLIWLDPLGLSSKTHAQGNGWRVDSEVTPGGGNVHVNTRKDKYYYDPTKDAFHDVKDGAPVSKNLDKALHENESLMRGVRNGVNRVNSQGKGIFRIGPKTAVTVSLVLSMLIADTVDAISVLGNGDAYRQLVRAIDAGNLEEADRWAEAMKDELVDGGHYHSGMNWIDLWEKTIKPKIRKQIQKQEDEKQTKKIKKGI